CRPSPPRQCPSTSCQRIPSATPVLQCRQRHARPGRRVWPAHPCPDPDCRVAVLSAEGKHFTAGLDLVDAAQMLGGSNPDQDPARKAAEIRRTLFRLQAGLSALERCSKPVIAAIHGGCIGGGVDLVAAADIRYCSSDAFFLDLGLAADLGSLQRLPKLLGSASLLAELTFTGRRLPAEEAHRVGLVSRVLDDRDRLLAAALSLASDIAAKSPVAVQAAKRSLLFARDHPVAEGLAQIAAENAAMLQSEDVARAVAASLSKEKPSFAKL
uniref:Delta(3,5)-Delta(2,4)-dienoyl-CoA isomerase, mitochondrial n=1 Tax=Macrostomum lignano TaxID=282301 RepID=A0A1I8IKS7_9PLAT